MAIISPISLDSLRVLDAIERKKSFAAAAESLFRVPSAITYTVQKLEEDLGVKLFEKRGRRSELTDVGRLVLDQGRLIIQATDELTLLARAVASGWEVELTLALDTAINFEPVYQVIVEFQQSKKHTQIRLREEVLAGCWDALISGEADIAIGPLQAVPSGVETVPIGVLDFVFVAAAQHPICALPQPLLPETVRAFPNVVIADSSRGLAKCSVGLLDGQHRITVPSIERKVEAIKAGLGVGSLPFRCVRAEVESGDIQVLASYEQRHAPELVMGWRRGEQGKALLWFVERLQQVREALLIN